MMKKFLTLAITALLLQPSLAMAQDLAPMQIIQKTLNPPSGKAFKGKRRLVVHRIGKSEQAEADIFFIDKNNYSIKILSPFAIQNIQFNMEKGVNNAYFPDEKLYLYNGDKDTSYIPEAIILGRVTDNPGLLEQNYTIEKLPDDFFASTPTYVLEITPKNQNCGNNGKGYCTPRRIYWIDKKNFQVLKETRYWTNEEYPYAESEYKLYREESFSLPPVTPSSDVRKVNLSGQEKNSFLTYTSIATAEQKEGVKIITPKYIPKGFTLKNIQVFTLFGARIQLLNYTDGMNSLLVTIRPEQNLFVTLLAGAFSLPLIQKVSRLSYHAPNNYSAISKNSRVAVAFGDIWPDELIKVKDSLPLDTAPAP